MKNSPVSESVSVRVLALFLLCLSGSWTMAVTADPESGLASEIAELKQGQEAIRKDLAELKRLLEERPGSQPSAPGFQAKNLEIGDSPVMGEEQAPVVLFSYSDYQCPYCRRHATTVMRQLESNYVDSGQLRIVFREYPIPTLHPRATAASIAAICAGRQNAYRAMHDRLFTDQKAMSDEVFARYAGELGLDEQAFGQCVSNKEVNDLVQADIREGQSLGVTGTPSFVIGLADPDNPDAVHVTRFIRGAQPYTAFQNAIEEQLRKSKDAD